MFASQYAPLEIVLLKPESIEEMEQAVQLLQRHSTVVVDMALLDDNNAQRFIDFLSGAVWSLDCLLYTSPSPRDMRRSRMPSSA